MYSADSTRTAADPQSARATQVLGKPLFDVSTSNLLKVTVEGFERSTGTELMSSQGVVDLGPVFGFSPEVTLVVDKREMTADDSQQRLRVSVEQFLQSLGPLDTVSWRLYRQLGVTAQQTREVRGTTFGGGFLGPIVETDILRLGRLDFEQTSTGLEGQAVRWLGGRRLSHLLTGGVTFKDDRFDQLRDRQESDLESGETVPSADGLTYPTKYFPRSRVRETGIYLQDEIDLAAGRLTLVPGLRYDAYDLDADQQDPLYLAGNPGTPAPVDMSQSEVSPKLGAIFAVDDRWSVHGQVARVDYSKPDFPIVAKIPAERFLHDGGWDHTQRYFMVAANMRNQIAVIDTKEKKLVTKFETGIKPHPGRGANWLDPEFGWVNATTHIGEGRLAIYGADPEGSPENAFKVVRSVELPTAGSLFVKTHPRSQWVWMDFPLSADEGLTRQVCVYSKAEGTIHKCRKPIERGRAVHFEYNKEGTEVWVSGWPRSCSALRAAIGSSARPDES